jgi:ubiquinone/menaquinone biosynthesis C-methylase UbiE
MSNTDQQTSGRQRELIRKRFTITAEAFGDFAVSYRAQFADALARLCGARPGDIAVDLACGPGTLALRFARQVKRVVGVDLTPAMLARARRNAAEEGLANLDFTIGDAQALPFADRALDLAVTSYSLHHMSDAARVVREMARIVKRGGRVGIIDIVVPENARTAELANRIEIQRDPSHTRTLMRSELEKTLTAAGLAMIAAEVGEMPRSFDHWMHVAGWHRGDRVYEQTRQLMEATMADDGANFHPRFAGASAAPDGAPPDDRPDLQIVNTALFIGAEKR